MLKIKKILVTGAAGYIGDCVMDFLVKQNAEQEIYKIYAIDDLLYTDSYMRPGMEFKKMNVTSSEFYYFVKKEKFDIIIHLAAIVGEPACSAMPIEATKINELVVLDLCKIIKAHSPKTRLIFSSTCSVYGNNNAYIKENSKTGPLGLYATTKLNAEKYVRSIKNHLIFRLPTVYGMSMPFGRFRTDLVANILTLRACEGQKLVVFGGEQWRPLGHVQDIGRIIAEAANLPHTGIYVLGNENYRIIDIAKKIDSLVKTSGGLQIVKELTELSNFKVDAKKAKDAGFKMRFTLKDGILQVEKCIKEGRIKNHWDIKYDNGRFIKNFSKE